MAIKENVKKPAVYAPAATYILLLSFSAVFICQFMSTTGSLRSLFERPLPRGGVGDDLEGGDAFAAAMRRCLATTY